MTLEAERRATTRSTDTDRIRQPRWPIYSMAFSILVLPIAFLTFNPAWFDRPVTMALNNLIRDWQLASGFAVVLAYPTLEGVIVVSLLWCCWFSGITVESRARILSGAVTAVFAGIIAEFVAVTPFPNSPHFPSERAAMFAGLAIAVFLIRPKLGLLAIGCTLVVGVSHVCLGLHRPTDILGSFCLAAALVCLAQMQLGSALGRRLMRWEAASGSTFYMCGFFSSYLVSTAFQDLRPLTSKFLRL